MDKAKLKFFYGTMGSGKSLEVLTTAYNFEQRNQKIAVIKSTIDTRDGVSIKSRIGNGIFRDCMPISPQDNIYDIFKDGEKYDTIFVDEAQFFV